MPAQQPPEQPPGEWMEHTVVDPTGQVRRLRSRLPAWRRPTEIENRLPMVLALVVAIVLHVVLPPRYGISPRWLIPALETGLLTALVAVNPLGMTKATTVTRYLSLVLVGLVTLANVVAAVLLARDIVTGAAMDAVGLLASGVVVYITNIIAFGIWYWELDRGGPVERARATRHHPDFLFPQMATPHVAADDWEPRFLDYLYVSLTNAVAFSPTDTMPMSQWAKSLMGVQSLVSLSVAALVVARGVNVLGPAS
jgi:branched-subunit amino acid transport protein